MMALAAARDTSDACHALLGNTLSFAETIILVAHYASSFQSKWMNGVED